MFDINKFIMDTLKGMKGNYPDFQIREYALNWYAKGKLTEENLAELEMYLLPPVEEEPEETEETPEETEETAEDVIEETTEVEETDGQSTV